MEAFIRFFQDSVKPAKVSKAIAGALSVLVALWLSKYGFTLEVTVGELVQALAAGISGYVVTYIAPRNR